MKILVFRITSCVLRDTSIIHEERGEGLEKGTRWVIGEPKSGSHPRDLVPSPWRSITFSFREMALHVVTKFWFQWRISGHILLNICLTSRSRSTFWFLFLSVHRGADERVGVRERVTVESDRGREHVWTSKCLGILSGALLCPPTPCQLGNVWGNNTILFCTYLKFIGSLLCATLLTYLLYS